MFWAHVLFSIFRNIFFRDLNHAQFFEFGDHTPDDIYVININRSRYKNRLTLGSLNLKISGTAHGQSISADQVIELTDDGKWTGNIIALPNNRVRATSPALWETGEGAPDFKPSQWTHSAESDGSYMDPSVTFDNLYSEKQ